MTTTDSQLGRKPHSDPPRKVTLSLPSSLIDWLDLYTYDPVAEKPSYGGRSRIITGLLREYKLKAQGTIGTNEVALTKHLKEHGGSMTDRQLLDILDKLLEASLYPNTSKLITELLEGRLAR